MFKAGKYKVTVISSAELHKKEGHTFTGLQKDWLLTIVQHEIWPTISIN